MPPSWVAVGGAIARVTIIAHVLLRKTVVRTITTQIALHVGRVTVIITADHKEAPLAIFQVGQRIANGSFGKDHVIVISCFPSQILFLHLVLEGPLTITYLLGNPLEAFFFLIKIAPVHILFAPFYLVAVQLDRHTLRRACGVARKLGSVTNQEIRLAVL